ncbi:MAG: TlpA family protein disulfide reductase [Nannocystis sp.]|nr:TlpA family protein disulfide reductase [Nannocystis sp.]
MTRWGSGSWLLVGFALGCGASPVVEGAGGAREAVGEVVAVAAAPVEVEVEVAGLRARVVAVAAANSRPKAGVRVELLGPAGEGGLAAEDAAIAATESDAEGGVRLELAAERTGFVRLRVSAGSVVAVRALDPRDRALAVEIEVHEEDGEVRAIELKAPGSESAALWQAEALAEGWAAAARGKRAGDPTLVANCEQAAAAVKTAEPALAGRLRVFFVRFAAQRCGLAAQVIAAELAAIGAKEPLWALDYALLMMPLNAMTTSPEARAAREATLAAVIAGHADAGLVGSLLIKQVMEGEGGDAQAVAAARAAAATLGAPRFAGTLAAEMAAMFAPDHLAVGAMVPDFSALTSDGESISRASLLGRPYVLDFWGTWCGGCVEEMPELHAAFADLNEAALGFNAKKAPKGAAGWRRLKIEGAPAVRFVSVAVHDNAEVVAAFRREQWPMPWSHVIDAEGPGSVAGALSVRTFPTVLFIDRAGVIVHRGGDLRAGARRLLEP